MQESSAPLRRRDERHMTPWVKRLLVTNVIVFVVLNGGLLGESGRFLYAS